MTLELQNSILGAALSAEVDRQTSASHDPIAGAEHYTMTEGVAFAPPCGKDGYRVFDANWVRSYGPFTSSVRLQGTNARKNIYVNFFKEPPRPRKMRCR